VKLRILTVAIASVLAVAGLAGCRTNVGTAAVIDGHRVTESDVNDYVTPNAKPVTLTNSDQSTSQVSPKSFVVQELVGDKLLLKLLGSLPKAPSRAAIDAELQTERKGKTYTQEAEALGLKGYTEGFYKIVLRVQLLQTGLQQVEQSGVDLNSAIAKLHFPVKVSARYGTWDAKTLGFSGNPVVPSYLKVQSTAAAQPAG
jgi:hypothetical protein